MFSTLKRDKQAVLAALFETPEGELVAKNKTVKVVFPVRYEESHLAEIQQEVYTLGIVAFIVEDKYSCNMLPAKLRFTPDDIEEVKYGEESYYVLTFEPGSVILPETDVLMEGTLGYYIYNYFIALGRCPWYMSAHDFITLFERTGEYTGLTYGDNHVVTEMITSMVLRDKENPVVYWRQTAKDMDALFSQAEVVPLRNVPLGARNTTAKLMGSYFNEGLNAALLYPSDNTEQVEELLRG